MKKMKCIMRYFLVMICLLFKITYVSAQQWDVGGNSIFTGEWFGASSASSIPISFEHRANSSASHFEWRTHNGTALGERMRLTREGSLGLNTTGPLARFHQNLGDFLVTGIGLFGASPIPIVPISGTGDRMMWIESMSAFRAGGVAATAQYNWDANNIGLYSIGLGFGPLASGPYSVSIGTSSLSEAVGSNCYGNDNHIWATGSNSCTLGNFNSISSANSIALGDNNQHSGEGLSYSLGFANISSGSNTVALGIANTISGTISGAFGKSINIISSRSYAIGCFLKSDANGNSIVGSGIDEFNPLTNSIANSLFVGFNSDVPTLFVGGGNGTGGSFGYVGIGNITSPTHQLDVNGTVRLRVIPNNTPLALITGVKNNSSDPDGDLVLNYKNFTGNSGDFLAGDGTWQNLLSATCDWNHLNTNQDVCMGYTGACAPRNVGIGINNPASKLQVQNTIFSSSASSWTVSVRSSQSSGVENIAGRFGATGYKGKIASVWGETISTSSADLAPNDYLIGVAGIAIALPQHCNYNAVVGVYGEAMNYAGGCNQNSFGGYFIGGLTMTGSSLYASDAALKSEINPIEQPLEKLMLLKPKQYTFNNEEYPMLALGEGTHCGFIAQEVAELFPEMVQDINYPEHTDENGNVTIQGFTYKGLNYIELIPVAIAAIQAQQIQIAILQEQLNACCSDTKSLLLENDGPVHEVELKSVTTTTEKAILYQNTPNPTSGECTIRYYVPSFVGSCEIHFFDAYGNVIKVVSITSTGMGQLHIEASDLTVGSYTYALVVDGTIVATRMMVKQ